MADRATFGTLVKFGKPFQVSSLETKKSQKSVRAATVASRTSDLGGLTLEVEPSSRPEALCQDQGLMTKTVEDILNAILPPMEWEEEGKIWRQIISTEPAPRAEVISLQRQLQSRLKLRQARETGICPIRRELFGQAFDELIRQVSLDCAERGLLLLRVRDEIRMTMSAYEALHEDATAFGSKKAIQVETVRNELKTKYDELDKTKRDLEKELAILKDNIRLADRSYGDQKEADDKAHFEQMQFLKRVNQLLKQQFDTLANTKKI